MKTPLISVIIPVFNSASFLDKCMKSVCEQTLKDIEILLINDGSTDNSLEICKKWADKDNRIKFINQENKGIAETRNIGIENSSAPLIGFVDSDDWIEKDMFEVLYNILKEEDADISICGVSIDYLAKNKSKKQTAKQTKSKYNILKSILFDKRVKSYCCNKLMKKELFKNIKFPAKRIFEDYATIYKVIDIAKKIIITEDIKYHYVKHINTTSITEQPNNPYREYHTFLAIRERFEYVNTHKIFKKNHYELFKIKVGIKSLRCLIKIRHTNLEMEKENIRNFLHKEFNKNDMSFRKFYYKQLLKRIYIKLAIYN